MRWAQFGVFCPVMRLHGSRMRTPGQPERHPGVKERSGGDNELWSFGDKAYGILKGLVELRERLKPYILHYMEIARKEGKPLMRPMFFDYPEDAVCYELEDQYFFGEDILFAPITEQGLTERKVYLPKGRWQDVNSKQVYDGGRWLDCTAPLEKTDKNKTGCCKIVHLAVTCFSPLLSSKKFKIINYRNSTFNRIRLIFLSSVQQ